MSSLVPRQMPDRNGRIVTRWVKPGHNTLPGNSFPPVGRETPSAEKISFRANALEESIKSFSGFDSLGFWKKRALMKTLDDDALNKIARNASGTQGIYGGHKVPPTLLRICATAESLAPINDLAAYLEDHGVLSEDTDTFEAAFYLNALQHEDIPSFDKASPFGFRPYSEASPEERETQHKIIKLTDSVSIRHGARDSVKFGRLRNKDLITYLKDHPENIERVSDIIHNRGCDPDAAEGLASIMELMELKDQTIDVLEEGIL